ncbi:MAG: hypothetical protein MPW15_29400 (plasmid) [Candidatus Manganitrophus sp.]|nr:hypothetical protein [Candidatus Manganitrophus sp.]MDC4228238.1 hypothetical protein [Candidatus Manganitrophus sp.]WDT77810.1 MAG: hypothetical protein MPW16_20900 [Candidatus Manganitrophus sp.]
MSFIHTARPVSMNSCFNFVLFIALISGCTERIDSNVVIARTFVGNTDGKVSVIEHRDAGNTLSEPIDIRSSAGEMVSSGDHIFVSIEAANRVAVLDPAGEFVVFKKYLPVGQRPVHISHEPESTRVWVLNDAELSTGIDTVTSVCNASSSGSVSVIEDRDENAGAILGTICVGKGHHEAAFSYPTSTASSIPRRAFISNMNDGTISVINNDPPSDDYLKVIGTLDLCDMSREPGGVCDADVATSNAAAPHEVYFSQATGKIYNYNGAYGTITIIDATTLAVESTVSIQSNGFPDFTPDGRFVFFRATDTQTDPAHVTGKLWVINLVDNSVTAVDLPDFHPGSLQFTSNGTKLYVASAAIGNADQRANQKSDVVRVFDATVLPALTQISEVAVGSTTGPRLITLFEHEGEAHHFFVTNPADGTITVIDARTDMVVDTVSVEGTPTSLLVVPIDEVSISHH